MLRAWPAELVQASANSLKRCHVAQREATASLAVLRDLAQPPKPLQEINAGVVNRLMREALVESIDLPSPYATHKGRLIAHLKASPAGVARLAQH